MTQQSILHLVVNWEVFMINICCFIAKILFQIFYLHLFGLLIKLALRCRGQIYTNMQNFVKIGHKRYHVFSIFKMAAVRNLDFQIFIHLVTRQVGMANMHRGTKFYQNRSNGC